MPCSPEKTAHERSTPYQIRRQKFLASLVKHNCVIAILRVLVDNATYSFRSDRKPLSKPELRAWSADREQLQAVKSSILWSNKEKFFESGFTAPQLEFLAYTKAIHSNRLQDGPQPDYYVYNQVSSKFAAQSIRIWEPRFMTREDSMVAKAAAMNLYRFVVGEPVDAPVHDDVMRYITVTGYG
ncbi:hypothetical protein ABW19_dt0209745 [Dactylella cylindrospora]|nr:hypothetical protein ABW19_dt0209745 [Dactylella cylindrospora]